MKVGRLTAGAGIIQAGRSRFGVCALNLAPFFDADPDPTPIDPPEPKEDLIPRAEARKAFAARDKAKQELDELKKRVLDEDSLAEYQTLKAQAAKDEEERAKKAGEFETLKRQQQERYEQLLKDHQKTLAEKESKYSTLTERFKTTVVKAEFGASTDYFSGSDSSKTILDVELGMAYLGKYVHVEDVEDDPLGYRVVVKNYKGDTIFGTDGNPAPFTEAIGELIKSLPNKDRILRGSGKTGSGSSGGSHSTTAGHIDTRHLKPSDFQDPKVRDQVRREQDAAGGLQMGRAWNTASRG